MGFKRLVSLACDGPCGTVLPETTRAPEDWVKVSLLHPESLAKGQKPSHPVRYAWLCPKCLLSLIKIMSSNGFCLNEVNHATEKS